MMTFFVALFCSASLSERWYCLKTTAPAPPTPGIPV